MSSKVRSDLRHDAKIEFTSRQGKAKKVGLAMLVCLSSQKYWLYTTGYTLLLTNKKFNSPRNGSTMKKIDRERQYTTERTSKH